METDVPWWAWLLLALGLVTLVLACLAYSIGDVFDDDQDME